MSNYWLKKKPSPWLCWLREVKDMGYLLRIEDFRFWNEYFKMGYSPEAAVACFFDENEGE
jgi:hypothetical protein